MKKIFIILISLMLVVNIAGCGSTGQTDDGSQQNESDINHDSASNAGEDDPESSIQVASDNAQIQTDDPSMPTRMLEKGTKINMHFGDTIIPGILEEEVHYGWLNGDIDYAIDCPYFTILHSDEEISEKYGYQVNIGAITCELSRIRDLSGSYDVLIELADAKEEVLSCVRGFAETTATEQADSSNDENSEETENITN